MRFQFGKLVLLWFLALILSFGAYLYNRNFYPEKDVFVKSADSQTDSEAEESSVPDVNSTVDPAPTLSAPDDSADEPPVPVAPQKINPVPESAPQDADYLNSCAFVGETNIFTLGQAGLLQPFSIYASDTLTLSNYTKEYVMLSGTTIRILSALNSASCPIYLMFGTESLAEQPADQTADQFSVLLSQVIAAAPEADVFVLSIPPVTADAEKGNSPILNSTIDEYNSLLLEICNEANVYFVDTNTALKNNDSRLDPYYAVEDGIHLTTEAGQILLDYVLRHVPMQ